MVDSPPRYLDEKSWDEMISEIEIEFQEKNWFDFWLPATIRKSAQTRFLYKWHPILHFYSKRKESLLQNEEQQMID